MSESTPGSVQEEASPWLVSGQVFLPWGSGTLAARLASCYIGGESLALDPPLSGYPLAVPEKVSRGLVQDLSLDGEVVSWPQIEEDEDGEADTQWGLNLRAIVERRGLAGLIELSPMNLHLRAPRRPSPGALVLSLAGLIFPRSESDQHKAFGERLLESLNQADRVILDSEVAANFLVAYCKQHGQKPPLVSVNWPAAQSPSVSVHSIQDRTGFVVAVSRNQWEHAVAGVSWIMDGGGSHPITILGVFEPDYGTRLEHQFRQQYPNRTIRMVGMPGAQGREEMFAGARGVIVPESFGQMGWIVAEAMVAGCPVVAPSSSEAAEIAGASVRGSVLNLVSEEDLQIASAAARDRGRELTWSRHCSTFRAILDDEVRCRRFPPGGNSGQSGPVPQGLLWYSPLPPSVGGVSRYSSCFLQSLADRIPLETRWTDQSPDPLPVYGTLRNADSAAELPIPANWLPVYNIQNNLVQGSASYEAMLRQPGLAILHDLNIHPFLLERHRQSISNQAGWVDKTLSKFRGFQPRKHRYFQELQAAHGEDGANEARNVITAGLVPDLPARSCHRLVTRSCAAVVVHGEWSARQLRANGDTATVYSLPLGIEHPIHCPSQRLADLRTQLGIRPGELVLVAAGILGHSRRLDTVLIAMAQAQVRGTPIRLVLCGSSEPGLSANLKWEAARLGMSDRLVDLGSVSDDDFSGCLLLADVVVHLHHPTSGQTSSTVLRAFSAGKPVLVSDTDSFRDLPDDLAWKVPTGETEIPVLAEYLVGLGQSEELRLEMGRRASEYIRQHHTWDRVAMRFMEILGDHRSWLYPSRPPYQWPLVP